MANLLSSFNDLFGAFSKHKYLDDGFDRANRIYAPVVFMISASLLGLIQLFGDPIEVSCHSYISTLCKVYLDKEIVLRLCAIFLNNRNNYSLTKAL